MARRIDPDSLCVCGCGLRARDWPPAKRATQCRCGIVFHPKMEGQIYHSSGCPHRLSGRRRFKGRWGRHAKWTWSDSSKLAAKRRAAAAKEGGSAHEPKVPPV